MNALSWILLLGIAGLLALAVTVTMSTCGDVTEHVLDATVVDMRIDVQEREYTYTHPGCPDCPGSEPRVVTTVRTEETHYVFVTAELDGEPTEFRIAVRAREYAALSVGDAVRVQLARSARDGRICGLPALVF